MIRLMGVSVIFFKYDMVLVLREVGPRHSGFSWK